MKSIMNPNFYKKNAEDFKEYYFQVVVKNKTPIQPEEIINE